MIGRVLWWLFWRLVRLGFWLGLIVLVLVLVMRWAGPGPTYLMLSERARLGAIEREWVPLEDIPAYVADAAVAAEDVHFCRHGGFDWAALRAAWADGASRGGSTISQQVAKNVFLWPERSWLRKGVEAGLTGLIERLWGKRRIMEMYLNVAEFGEGVFGVEAGAQAAFGRGAAELTRAQAARLMSVLPAPRDRSPVNLGDIQARRLPVILDGSVAVGRDARGACYRP